VSVSRYIAYDMKTVDVTLLTDGKSRNCAGPWSSSGDQIA